MADNQEFKHDPEAEEDTKKYRLPFALLKLTEYKYKIGGRLVTHGKRWRTVE